MRFVQKSGTWSVQVGGRSDTPILEMDNITKGNTIMVTVTFLAKTNGSADSGFWYTVQATNADEVQALSAQQSVVQGNAGFQTTTKTVFFEAKVSSATGVEDVDFEVTFQKGDLDGQGQISDFLMTGAVVSLGTP